MPAWPMPIHQTKLTMANPQATGMLMPQMPTPVHEQVGDRAIRRHQHQGKRDGKPEPPAARRTAGSATMALILSVIVPNVCPARARDRRSVVRVVHARRRHRVALSLRQSRGLGLRSVARYVVRGLVFSSASRP